jgi:hypothetical protein
METTLENGRNRPFVRADRNVPMHLIKPGLRHQDLEDIHLPSFIFSWKLKKLFPVDFFVFESWQRRRNGFTSQFHPGSPRFKNKKIDSTKFL